MVSRPPLRKSVKKAAPPVTGLKPGHRWVLKAGGGRVQIPIGESPKPTSLPIEDRKTPRKKTPNSKKVKKTSTTSKKPKSSIFGPRYIPFDALVTFCVQVASRPTLNRKIIAKDIWTKHKSELMGWFKDSKDWAAWTENVFYEKSPDQLAALARTVMENYSERGVSASSNPSKKNIRRFSTSRRTLVPVEALHLNFLFSEAIARTISSKSASYSRKGYTEETISHLLGSYLEMLANHRIRKGLSPLTMDEATKLAAEKLDEIIKTRKNKKIIHAPEI